MFATPDPSRSSPLARNLRLLQIEAGPHNARVFNRPVISRLVQGSPTSTPVIPYAVSGVTPARARFTVPLLFRQRRWRGSSPLARGLRAGPSRRLGGLGIIPARAGFTSSAWPGRSPASGSSPLARGLLSPSPLRGSRHGIIPARAGFTVVIHGAGWGARDHPRSRGVYHRRNPSDVPQLRIIPARAGFTPRRIFRSSSCWDHPRSRGVYSSRPRSRRAAWGSSPLARGLLALRI